MKNNIVFLFLFFTALTGCVSGGMRSSGAPPEVVKGEPVVYVYPLDVAPYRHASVSIPPFLVPENMSEVQAEQVAGLFKNVLLGQRAFPKVKQLQQAYGDAGDAIKAGRQAGTDLVLAGEVNYAIDGTELGGARAEISVRLLNVSTGNTVWYITQNIDQPVDYPQTDLLSRVAGSFSPPAIKRINGGSALQNMLVQIAVDMADVMSGRKQI